MSFINLIGLALGLALDAMAISLTNGFVIRHNRLHHALSFSVSFALFQMVMPVLGWSLGTCLAVWIKGVDHWLAFILLSAVGAKMIYESLIIEEIEERRLGISFATLMGLSLATSVDALAVGVTFAFLDIRIITPVLWIGAVTFVMSFGGFYLGQHFGKFLERKMEVWGGVILILIGVKILLEHLLAGG